MARTITLMPFAAAERICHEEQLAIWVAEVVVALSLGGFLRRDLDYSDGIDLQRVVAGEIEGIVRSAFAHPEARTVMTLPEAEHAGV